LGCCPAAQEMRCRNILTVTQSHNQPGLDR
jgi:hypothetical protein